MKRINNKAAAVEACITGHGTIVGPFMTDLTGYPELTPYKGGWCGNDLFPEALTPTQRATAISHVQRLGGRLAQEGYKGFLEIDVLIDTDTDEVYLGELNPRISGASSMTNVTAGAYADVPLFLFHLLEFMDVDYVVDVEEINERWLELAAIDVWAQLIMKEPVDSVERILAAPRTGTYLGRRRQAHVRTGLATTGTRSPTRTRRSTCGSMPRATSGSREPTSESSSPRAGCRPRKGSRSGASATSTASAGIPSEALPSPPAVTPLAYVKYATVLPGAGWARLLGRGAGYDLGRGRPPGPLPSSPSSPATRVSEAKWSCIQSR